MGPIPDSLSLLQHTIVLCCSATEQGSKSGLSSCRDAQQHNQQGMGLVELMTSWSRRVLCVLLCEVVHLG